MTTPFFDPEWYLAAYPDVAAAAIDPWQHYCEHGRAEGRLPRCNRALALEHHLWRGADDVMLQRLSALIGDGNIEEQLYSRWAMARWFACRKQWGAVLALLVPDGQLLVFDGSGPELGPGPGLLALTAACQKFDGSRTQERLIKSMMIDMRRQFPDCAEIELAQSNVLGLTAGNAQKRLVVLNRLFKRAGLTPVGLKRGKTQMSFDALAARPRLSVRRSAAKDSSDQPLVSVIVPMHNAKKSIATVLASLFEQTWRPLEIIVVDDASSDESADLVTSWQSRCPVGVSLLLLRHGRNRGAYAARNTGLKKAKGALITTHDSDDWSHPEKLERQVQALQSNDSVMGCLSHWVRASQTLVFGHWITEKEGWTYRNMSSLMFRREVFDTLGFFDEVRVNADTEFHERVMASFGQQSVIDVLPGVPLSFGRVDLGSLSQRSQTHLVTQFLGVRHDYMASARRWRQSASQSADLYVGLSPKTRPFVAPTEICVNAAVVKATAVKNSGNNKANKSAITTALFVHPLDEIQASGLFDAGWYLRTHIDLQQHAIEALDYFWTVGVSEGRDPGPAFSVSGYLARYPQVRKSGLSPLLHYLRIGQRKGYEPLPIFKGKMRQKKSCATILLVGHAVGHTLYGAERSLLDVARAITYLGFNLVVALPSAINEKYLEVLMLLSRAVAVAPYGWWQTGKEPSEVTLGWFKGLIETYDVDLMHVNTVVLDEPLTASRLAGIPCLVHVRELAQHDQALCDTLNASPDEIKQRVLQMATGIIANSECVRDWFGTQALGQKASKSAKVVCVPNTADLAPLLRLALPVAKQGVVLRVGMLSSHVPKKGLAELEALSHKLQAIDPKISLILFGPCTPALEALLARQEASSQPANIVYAGYVGSPEQAIKKVDVVINLSRFQESFGRTVLEAMAGARPVVVYNWGALPELVEDEVTGFVVPFGDTDAVAMKLSQLRRSPTLRHKMGKAGRIRADECYSLKALAQRLSSAYETLGDLHL
jgi:glycosyltransferase involved in cell wall biosynthesis